MLALLRDLDTTSYTHRSYVVSDGDSFSSRKAEDFEEQLAGRAKTDRRSDRSSQVEARPYDISMVPRARKIHQPLVSSPLSALQCLLACFSTLRRASPSRPHPQYPDLVITNGPATAVCVVLACLMLRFFAVRGSEGKMRTIYVESWARVRGLSLSGKILVRCVDRFLVQWEGLEGVGGRAEYIGVLV